MRRVTRERSSRLLDRESLGPELWNAVMRHLLVAAVGMLSLR